ncbi:MAG: ribbon-helix-helix domain-containing protein [Methylovirgula sp.]|jgi:predicted DNA-binding ribbon-helix-helix protein
MTTEARPAPRSAAIDKHSLTIAGHRTSISLERAFWDDLRQIAAHRGRSIAALVAEIDARRGAANLCSAIRVYVLAAHRGAGHRGSQ